MPRIDLFSMVARSRKICNMIQHARTLETVAESGDEPRGYVLPYTEAYIPPLTCFIHTRGAGTIEVTAGLATPVPLTSDFIPTAAFQLSTNKPENPFVI